jgi:hypothetical protein
MSQPQTLLERMRLLGHCVPTSYGSESEAPTWSATARVAASDLPPNCAGYAASLILIVDIVMEQSRKGFVTCRSD